MKKRLQDMEINNKKIVLRCDFNVPIKDGKILDTNKIDKSLETINYLLDKNCSIVILSHFGKVKKESDKKKNTLEPVYNYLNSVLGDIDIRFSSDTRSVNVDKVVASMKQKEILLLENTRYEDIPDNLESGNHPQLASYWASLGDVFVMDAFASAHRSHASTVGIAKYIPSCIGLLVQKEIEMLDNLVLEPKKPFTLIMGGAKIEDKLDLLDALVPRCDNLLLSGCLANTCLKALGFNVASSLVSKDENIISKMKQLMLDNKDKIILPLDAIVGSTYNSNLAEYRLIDRIETDEIIYDIGIKTIDRFKDVINNSKTVFINGTVGLYEDWKFANGTKEVLSVLSKCNATVVVGGGDSVSALTNLGFKDKIKNISSGGGATLKYLANRTLPGIDDISNIETEGKNYEILDI